MISTLSIVFCVAESFFAKRLDLSRVSFSDVIIPSLPTISRELSRSIPVRGCSVCAAVSMKYDVYCTRILQCGT